MRKELFAYWFLLSVSTSIIGFLYPLYLSSGGMQEREIGVLLGTGSLISLFILIAFSSHSDKVGRKVYLFVFGLLSALSATLFTSYPAYISYLGAVVLLQVCSRSTLIFGKIISIESFSSEKGKTYGIFSISLAAGSLAGSTIAGKILDILGFLGTFRISILISLLAIIPLLFLGPINGKKRHTGNRGPVFYGFLIQRFLSSAGFSTAFSFAFLLYLRSVFGLSYTMLGFVGALQSLASMAGLSLGNFTDGKNHLKVTNFSITISSISMISVFFWNDLIAVITSALVSNFMVGVASTNLPHFFDKVASNLGKDVVIIDGSGITLGSGFGSVVAGSIIGSFGYSYVFPVAGALQLLSTVVLYVLFRGKDV